METVEAMLHLSRVSRRRIAAFLLAILLTALLNYLTPWYIPVIGLGSLLYSVILAAWALSVWRRILQHSVRRSFVLGACLIISMFLMRHLRYYLPAGQEVLRYLWYAYYIPLTAVPLEFFGAALNMGREEKAPRILCTIFITWLLLIALIMTNDLHGLMFRISGAAGGLYTHGPLYLVTFLWIATVTLASFAVLMRRCRLSQCRRLWFVPVLAAGPGLALLIWYIALGGNSPMIFGHNLYLFHEAYAILFLFVWESCIQIGLIPCNTDYERIFTLLPLHAFITDEAGNVKILSENAAVPSAEKLASARSYPTYLDDDHVLLSHDIRGGSVYWIEDISAINAVNREIASDVEFLEDEQALLEEEARIKAERASYETQNRLYDSLSPLVQPRLAAAERLISENSAGSEEEFRECLTLAMVLCVHAKRRVNLALIASKNDAMPLGELELAIRETLEYLRIRGVFCSEECRGSALNEIPAAKLLLLYDFFADLVEVALPNLSALFVLLRADGQLGIDITMEPLVNGLPEHWRLLQRENLGAFITETEEDGVFYVRLRFGEAEKP